MLLMVRVENEGDSGKGMHREAIAREEVGKEVTEVEEREGKEVDDRELGGKVTRVAGKEGKMTEDVG